nr:hypothetical protein [Soybean yellow mottle mosaic virus]
MEQCSPSPNSPRRRRLREGDHSPRISESDSMQPTDAPLKRCQPLQESPQGESLLPFPPMCPMEFRTTLYDKTNRLYSILSFGELLCLIALSPLLISLGHSTQVILQHSIGYSRSPRDMTCIDSLIVRSSTLPGVRLPLQDRLYWRMTQMLVMLILTMSPISSIWLALSLVRSFLPFGLSRTLSSSTVMCVTTPLVILSWLMLAKYLSHRMASNHQPLPSPSVR